MLIAIDGGLFLISLISRPIPDGDGSASTVLTFQQVTLEYNEIYTITE